MAAVKKDELRIRVREWGIRIGEQEPADKNAIIDVPGVLIGNVNIVEGNGPLEPGKGPIRTGVSAIWPARGNLVEYKIPAAIYVINGFSKCLGLTQIEECGCIETPLLITNTLNVGKCADALIEYLYRREKWKFHTLNPVVMECNDRFLNDIVGRHVRAEHVIAALDGASDEQVLEGNAGAGVGMKCYSFKGGIGTSSRKVIVRDSLYRVGCLVCTNMGTTGDLIVDGIHVGKALRDWGNADSSSQEREYGSIVVLLATDAPLESRQLKRVASRATHGLSRTGTYSDSGSGDIVLAWTTGYRIGEQDKQIYHSAMHLSDDYLNPFFRAAADCTEEAILNSLWMAETLIGGDDHILEKLPLEKVRNIMRQANYCFCEK